MWNIMLYIVLYIVPYIVNHVMNYSIYHIVLCIMCHIIRPLSPPGPDLTGEPEVQPSNFLRFP